MGSLIFKIRDCCKSCDLQYYQEWKKQSRGDGDYKLDSLGRCLADIQNEVLKRKEKRNWGIIREMFGNFLQNKLQQRRQDEMETEIEKKVTFQSITSRTSCSYTFYINQKTLHNLP